MTDTITNGIISTINSIFQSIFSSVDNNLYEILDKLTFLDEKIVQKDNFIKIFGSNSGNGMLLITNTLLMVFFLYYVMSFSLSHLINTKVQRPLPFIFKLIIVGIVMNNSLFILEEILKINSIITKLFQNIGEDLFNEKITFSNFLTHINNNVYKKESFDVSSFEGIIKSFATFGFLNLIFSYALRYIMIQVFAILIPISFLCLVNQKTEWIFKSIFKAFISLLLEQILVALILLVGFSFSFSSDNDLSKILCIGVIYSLMKANTFMYMIFGGITTSISSGISSLTKKGDGL